MPKHSTTSTRALSKTPSIAVKLVPTDLEPSEPRDWTFLQRWASNLGVSLEVLLHRLLVAAVIGQIYVEKIPEL